MRFEALSPMQRRAALWWRMEETRGYDAVICDGAVRSGKTMSLGIGFMLWALSSYNGQIFALCGKSVESLRRNVIFHLPEYFSGTLRFREIRSENRLEVTAGGRKNTFYLFGGWNEQSRELIQGITLAGVLLDEAAIMPRSFVEMAISRCSVAGSRVFFSCNPETTGNWFYREWIQKAEEKHALYLHFTMDDNPSLSDEVRERYKRAYAGAFYRRYVLGQWCTAEGLVYRFDPEKMVSEEMPKGPVSYFISVDYGTRNPCSMGLWAVGRDGKALRMQEFYYDSRRERQQMTDEDYYLALEKLAGDREVEAVVVDPSALSFLTTIRRHGRFSVRKADNDVLSGIRTVSCRLADGSLLVHPSCRDALREFTLYHWESGGETDRLAKEDDHAMDDIRYFVMTVLERLR